MDNQLFRKKSLERISSPEQLNDYIRVSNPGVWTVLAAIIVVLVGICIWGVFGRMETVLTAAAVADQEGTVCYVRETEIGSVAEGMPVRIGEAEYHILSIGTTPFPAESALSEYAMHIMGLQEGEWVYEMTLDNGLSSGVYEAEVVVERIAPMSFVIN